MIANFVLGILCLLVVLFSPNKKRGLRWAFFATTVFLGIRYMWGNDYPLYLDNFSYFNSFNFDLFDISSNESIYKNSEFGWVILNRIFGKLGLGFFGLVLVLSIFENWVIYHLISKYVNPNYYWVAIIIYVFSTSFAINSAMIRQYLCICMYLLVVELMIERNVKGYLFWSIGIVLLGTTFHRANIFVLFSLPLFYIKVKPSTKLNFWMIAIAVAFLIWSIIGYNLMANAVTWFFHNTSEYSSYEVYLGWEKSGANTGLGVAFRYVMFLIWLILLFRFEEREKQIIIILGLFSYFLESLVTVIPLASRFQAYFAILNMIRWSWLVQFAKGHKLLYTIFLAQLVIMAREYIGFYYSDTWTDLFFTYQTIFEAGHWM